MTIPSRADSFCRRIASAVCFAMLVYFGCASPFTFGAEYVIHISVDGLNAGILQSLIDAGEAPNFKRFEDEGAWTLNGRTDFSHTDTLPNHTTMLTGRPVLRPADLPHAPFHNGTENSSPQKRATLHKDGYIPSVFDVVHDAGRSTALYASKDKFAIYDQSYDETNGAIPRGAVSPRLPSASLGETRLRGRDKIDKFLTADDGPPRYSQGLNERFVEEMGAQHYNYAFVHYRDPDSAGHATRWGSSAYRQAIHGVDEYLGAVFRLVESDPQFKDKTTIILTADHGGWALGHDDPEVAESYTIPIFVWGAGVARGDLYAMNDQSRTDPGKARVDYAIDKQPIRNGDTGNLALSLLALGPIPTSLIDAAQDLRVAIPGDYNFDGTVDAADEVVWRNAKGATTNLRADGNRDGRVDEADYELWKANFGQTATAAK